MGVVLGRVQNQSRGQGKSDVLSRTIRTVVEVPAAPLGRLAEGTSDFFGGIGRAGSLQSEVRRLRAQASIAETYMETVTSLRQEIEDLRNLMNMPQGAGRMKIPARVIGFFPMENRLTIDAGTAKQIKPGLAVVAGDGLVGVVQTADSRTAQVRLLSSPRPFMIGATVLRKPATADTDTQAASISGLMHGEAPDRLTVEFLDLNAPIDIGDLVVTSGFSELIPHGIPIGRIVQVYKDDEFGTRIAQVFPAVTLSRVREVIVLR